MGAGVAVPREGLQGLLSGQGSTAFKAIFRTPPHGVESPGVFELFFSLRWPTVVGD